MTSTRRALLALAASGGLARAPARASQPPPPLTPRVTLTLGVNSVPHLTPFASIADELRPLGVDVEPVRFQRYADTRAALSSGAIDMGSIGPGDVAIAVSQGLRTVVGLMGVGISPKYPIVRKGIAVASWGDLIGRKVGLAPGSAVWFQFTAALTEAELPYAKLTALNMQGPGSVMVQAMQRGDIDVFIGWEPFESMAVAQGLAIRAERLDYSRSRAVGAELGLVAVNRAYLDAQREAVRRFVWAYLVIQQRLMASKETLALGIAGHTGLPVDVARHVAATMTLGQFLTLEQMQRQAATFHRLGVLARDVSGELGSYFDGGLVESVVRE